RRPGRPRPRARRASPRRRRRRPVRGGAPGVPQQAARGLPRASRARARALRAHRRARRCRERRQRHLVGDQPQARSVVGAADRGRHGYMSRSDDQADGPLESTHPRQTTVFFGHRQAEPTLLEAFRSGRIPHAWLLGGPAGIGKATLAYRMARFVLAHADPAASAVRAAQTLALDPALPVVRQVAGQAHPDLLVLERTENDKGVLRTEIVVEQVARTVSFFGSTASVGGWRVCIVDSVEELNPSGANKLLKILEEPPPRSLFLLVSHAPGRLSAPIRSRCRRLDMRALAEDDLVLAAAALAGTRPDDPAIRAAAAAADGSVARALMFLGGPALALRQRV